LRGFRRRSGVAADHQPNRQPRDGIAQLGGLDDGIRTLNGGEVISSVSHMRRQGLASRSTKYTLRMFQQSNSLGTLRKILHTYGLPNRWEVGGEMTRGNDAQVVGRQPDHRTLISSRCAPDGRPGDVRHHRLPDTSLL